ncbi:facilitated trehalose transporter Tret1-like isoform X2 [Battus philenor]|uniref:facilitated trehalose transporter Tret1-like isoform X2 n=1 Tax=Battus philenor TaxID=42288 RepID=UPI0035D07196
MSKTKRTVQYFAGICATFAFTFTGATISWSSPVIPKIKSGEANLLLTDVMLLFTTMPGLIYLGRFLSGISNGITAVVTMVYLTEIADKEIRGALGMLVQVMINLGALSMYGIGPFVSYTAINSIVLAIPVINLLLCLWLPESPYYHLKDERFADAKKVFMILKGCKDVKWAEEQLGIIRIHVRESMENKSTVMELFSNMKYRKAVYIVTGLKILQYMTGCLAIQSYLENIFAQSSSVPGAYVSIVYGILQLVAGVGATFLAGYFGRRILMGVSSAGVAFSMTIVGLYFFLQDTINISAKSLETISSMPLVGVLLFNVLYAVGLGTIPYIMQAELFPINVKTVASSSATMMACILNFVVTKCYQGVKDMFGHYIVFWSFALIAYLGIVFIYYFVPETKSKTLEEIQDFMDGKKNLEVEMLNERNDSEILEKNS